MNDVSSAGSGQIITSDERTKLDGIATGAEVNVQSNWNESDSNSDTYIQNKPTIPSGNQIIDWTGASAGTIDSSNIPTLNQDTTGSAASLSSTLSVSSGGTGQTTYENGELLIGNTTGNTLTKATLTAGNNVTITNGTGTITIDSENTTYSAVTSETNGLMTSSDKTKLDGIATGAEVNVQSDWNETNTNSDAYIQNKPTIPSGNQIIDWTGSTAGTIHSTNIPTLNQDTTGTAAKATKINLTAETTDTTNYILFSNDPTGNQLVKTNGNLRYNATTNVIFGGISHMYVYNDSSWTTNGYLMMTYNTSGLGGNNSVGASNIYYKRSTDTLYCGKRIVTWSGNSNTLIGDSSGNTISSSGSLNNTIVGTSAGQSLNSSYNSLFGSSAGSSFTGSNNVSIGYLSGRNMTGSSNIVLGPYSGFSSA